MKKTFLILLFIAVSLAKPAFCQSAIASSGTDGTGTSGSFSFTVGQLVYTTLTGTTGSAAQGVQQPFNILSATGIELRDIDLKWNAFPNPVSEKLTLKAGGNFPGELSFRLTDLSGKLLNNEKIVSPETEISFSGFRSGTYFLRIFLSGNEIKVFKIIKF